MANLAFTEEQLSTADIFKFCSGRCIWLHQEGKHLFTHFQLPLRFGIFWCSLPHAQAIFGSPGHSPFAGYVLLIAMDSC